MLYPVSADAFQGFRLMLDTPAHEGVERGRAAVQGALWERWWTRGYGIGKASAPLTLISATRVLIRALRLAGDPVSSAPRNADTISSSRLSLTSRLGSHAVASSSAEAAEVVDPLRQRAHRSAQSWADIVPASNARKYLS